MRPRKSSIAFGKTTTVGPEELRKVSALLDEVLQMPDGMRDAWLARLEGDDARLSPLLRRLLATDSGAKESLQFLGEMPAFTAPAAAKPASAFAVGDRVGPYRLVRELGPLSDAAPAFPLAATALAPLRARAEGQGSGDFSPLWAGQNTSGCREVAAAVLTRELLI